MSKLVLVDSFDDTVKGVYKSPITFAINGNYLIELPDSFIDDNLSTNLTTLETNKRTEYLSLYPMFTNASSEEFYDDTGIDNASCTNVVFGPLKKTIIKDGGTLVTTSVVVPATTKYFVHLDIFQAPLVYANNRIRNYYNFDGTNPIILDPTTDITVSLDDGGGAGPTAIIPDTIVDTPSGGSQTAFTLSVSAVSTDIYISSFVVLTE
jgi:hypothetical protein